MHWKSNIFGLMLMLALATASWGADDGADLYKKKCASCHGANGEGKPAMKAPALKGTNLDASQIADRVTKGTAGSKAPHAKPINGLTAEQATAIADYVKSLK